MEAAVSAFPALIFPLPWGGTPHLARFTCLMNIYALLVLFLFILEKIVLLVCDPVTSPMEQESLESDDFLYIVIKFSCILNILQGANNFTTRSPSPEKRQLHTPFKPLM